MTGGRVMNPTTRIRLPQRQRNGSTSKTRRMRRAHDFRRAASRGLSGRGGGSYGPFSGGTSMRRTGRVWGEAFAGTGMPAAGPWGVRRRNAGGGRGGSPAPGRIPPTERRVCRSRRGRTLAVCRRRRRDIRFRRRRTGCARSRPREGRTRKSARRFSGRSPVEVRRSARISVRIPGLTGRRTGEVRRRRGTARGAWDGRVSARKRGRAQVPCTEVGQGAGQVVWDASVNAFVTRFEAKT